MYPSRYLIYRLGRYKDGRYEIKSDFYNGACNVVAQLSALVNDLLNNLLTFNFEDIVKITIAI